MYLSIGRDFNNEKRCHIIVVDTKIPFESAEILLQCAESYKIKLRSITEARERIMTQRLLKPMNLEIALHRKLTRHLITRLSLGP